MGKLVLDTNALLQVLPRISKYHELWVSLFDGRNQLCVSNEILEEYEEILEIKTSHLLATSVISQIIHSPHTSLITPYYNFYLISDPDDNKFVDCAVAGEAKFIVTEDHHFNILREIPFPKVDIISLDEIMKQL